MQLLKNYLGTPIESERHKELLFALSLLNDSKKTVIVYKPSTEYHCYYEEGIALCFEKSQLDSIDFYKISGDRPSSSKYKSVLRSRLPEGIDYNATGKELVEKFGEPLEKGGGMSSKIDIWLRWKGIQFEIPTRNWDLAKETGWSSFTLFK